MHVIKKILTINNSKELTIYVKIFIDETLEDSNKIYIIYNTLSFAHYLIVDGIVFALCDNLKII